MFSKQLEIHTGAQNQNFYKNYNSHLILIHFLVVFRVYQRFTNFNNILTIFNLEEIQENRNFLSPSMIKNDVKKYTKSVQHKIARSELMMKVPFIIISWIKVMNPILGSVSALGFANYEFQRIASCRPEAHASKW